MDFDLGSIETVSSGMDSFLEDTPREKTASTGRIKVASLEDLKGFERVAEDQLVHRSNRDLWSLKKDPNGDFFIERLFEDSDKPLKG